MGIYRNESVKSLPEQVQENKENIKNLEEEVERIDPEAITAVIDQVATNTQDISNIKAEQVVQNTAIGANTQNISDEKTTRESVVGVNVSGNTYLKTATPNKQIIIQNNGYISLLSGNGNALVLSSQDVEMSSVNTIVTCIANEGVKIQTNTSAVNPFELVLKNTGDFEVKNGHVLKFDTTGAITIDGQPIGGEGTLYKHTLLLRGRGNNFVVFEALLNDNTPINTTALLLDLLKNKQKNFLCNGLFDSNNLCYLGYYSDTEIGCRSTNFTWYSLYYTDIVTITDVINTITI